MVVDEFVQIRTKDVLKVIKDTDCEDVREILLSLFPNILPIPTSIIEFKQIKIAITSKKDHRQSWSGYIGTATKGELNLLNSTLYGEDNQSQCIVIAIAQGVGERAGKNIKTLLDRTIALTLHGDMDKVVY